MINLDELLSDLKEWIKTDCKLNNTLIRLNNLKSYLDEETERIQRERTYKIKLPLRLFIHQKYLFDDVSDPEELEQYKQAIDTYNKDVATYTRLLDKDKYLINEISEQIKALTFEQYQNAMNGHGTLEEFKKLKNVWYIR